LRLGDFLSLGLPFFIAFAFVWSRDCNASRATGQDTGYLVD
jgi:hypothetical protein